MTLQLCIISDIHTELQNISDYSFLGDPKELDPGSILIMAGDLGSPTLAYENYRDLLMEASLRYEHVLIVPGNNEYRGGEYSLTMELLTKLVSEFPRVHLLDRSSVRIEGILFIGATLWSSVVKEGFVNPAIDIAIPIEQREMLHRLDREYLEFTLSQHPYRSVVVITHHPPIHSFRERDILTSRVMKKTPDVLNSFAYYGNNLESLVDRSRVWICGHVHIQWTNKVNQTPVILNAMGTLNENLGRGVRTLLLA